MAPLSLKIVLEEGAVTRKVKFDSKMTAREAHGLLKDKVIVPDPTKEYALFLRSADNVLAGIWLENHRTLDYYMLRDGDSLDYICRIRNLRVKLLDGTVKTLQVDEAKTVNELLEDICRRFLIMNYDEYGLCPEEEIKPDEKKVKQQAERDVTLETLSKTLHTDDNVVWLDQHRTLREQGVLASSTLLLKRRLFYSDRKVDERDPVQLNLLYVQIRDAVLCGHHLVTEDQAADCKVRWINIRDVHRRILRKILTTGTRPNKMYKYENELSFMKQYYKDVANASVSCDDEEKDSESNMICDDDDVQDASSDNDSEKPIKKIKVKRRNIKKRKEVTSVYEDEKQETVSPSGDAQQAVGDFDTSDPIDAFLLSIGSTLKSFSPYHLNVAKSKIFSVVQEHELQQIVERERQGQSDVKISVSEESYVM